MTPNEFLQDRITLIGVRLSQIELSVFRELDKRVNQVSKEFSVSSLDGLRDQPNLPNAVSNAVGRSVSRLLTDLDQSLKIICVRLSAALTASISGTSSTEQLNISLIDPFGIAGLSDENAFTVFAEMLGITEDEARELYASLMLWGFFIPQVLEGWRVRLMLQIENRLASQLNTARSLNVLGDFAVSATQSQVTQAVQSTVRSSLTDSVQSLKEIASAILFGNLSRQTMKLATKNPSIFVGRFIWIAVLDGRVCRRCGRLHGQSFRVVDGEFSGPVPPLHGSCRCILVPLMGGAIQAQSFDDWFRKQPLTTQVSILGVKGATMYRNNQLRISDFVSLRKNGSLRSRTLPEIEKR